MDAPDFVFKRRGHKPYSDYDATVFGGFLAGVAIGVGVIVAVRFGPRLFVRVFLRKITAFVTKAFLKNVMHTVVIGPLPGTVFKEAPSSLYTVLAVANVGMWVTGLWFYIFDAVDAAKQNAFDATVDAAIDFGLAHDILYQVPKPPIQVIDNGNPFVVVINGGGTAFYGVGPAWRTDP